MSDAFVTDSILIKKHVQPCFPLWYNLSFTHTIYTPNDCKPIMSLRQETFLFQPVALYPQVQSSQQVIHPSCEP